MKKMWMIVILSLAVFSGYSQSVNETGDHKLSKNEQEVWGKVIELHNAVFGNKDSVVISKLAGSGLQYGHSGGNLEDRAAMIHNASNSKTLYENVTNRLLSLKIINNVAIVRLVLKASSIEKGVASPLNLGIIQVWNKVNGQWKLIERQAVKRSVP